MLKKIVSGLLSVSLGLITLVILSLGVVTPASANSQSIGYCQATASDRNPYNFITASVDSLLDKDGNLKQGGFNSNDIVPKFDYITRDSVRKYFEGQNTTKDFIAEEDCPGGSKLILAQPNDPTYIPPTCKNPEAPYGSVAVPQDLGTGVASASVPVLSADSTKFSVYYTLKAPTKTEYFEWQDVSGDTKNYIFNTTHISSDPLWIFDEKSQTGKCELSKTGAGESVRWEYIPLAAGMLLIASILFILKPFIERKA